MLSVAVIVTLLVAIWATTVGGDESPTAAATQTPTSLTTTSTAETPALPAPTTTALATTIPASTTVPVEATTDPEARAEEVRLILQDLYFRWFDAIYRNDEEAVLDVVATQQELEGFRHAVEVADWPRAPRADEILIEDLEILVQDDNCLAVHRTTNLQGWLGAKAATSGVDVLWPHDSGWRFATHWKNQHDLWEADCTSARLDELP